MKWFKHESNAHDDAKLKRVRNKYGMEGYGLYWYCLELIAQNIDSHNLTFELEHDAEIIAQDLNLHYEKVQEMMAYMVKLELFESAGGLITCLKMAIRTDEYTQQLMRKQRSVPTNSRSTPDNVPINSQLIERKERKDKNKSGRFTPPLLIEIENYCLERKNDVNPSQFFDFYEAKNWMIGKNKMKNWQAAVRTWEKSSKPKQLENQESFV